MMLQGPSLRQSPSLRPLTTAHLAQTMALLQLPVAELNQKIESELARNPALELNEEKRCPTCRRLMLNSKQCPRCSTPKSLSSDEPIIFVSPREDFYIPGRISTEERPDDNISPIVDDLPTYVMRQIAPELQPEDQRLAAHLLTSLDDDGLLEVPLMEVARYHHVSISQVENVLALIQHAEPVGVGSLTPQEALLVQLEVLGETISIPPLAAKMINVGMSLLSRHQYTELGQLLGITARQAKEIARFISDNLNPFPARSHWGDIRQGNGPSPNVYTHPDVIISILHDNQDGPLVVEIVSPYAGLLHVNPLFRRSISQAPPEKAGQWKSDLERAELLVKCLQQRTNTIVRLMRRITTMQRNFILLGDIKLKPVTRASLATELEVHESTISRAVASKTVQLPNGHIIPLAKFFDRSLPTRTALKKIIDNEAKPLSDNEIVGLLKKQGFSVARRTVAKYRSMEGILPSHLRKMRPQAKTT